MKKQVNYDDIDLIISQEALRKNRERTLREEKENKFKIIEIVIAIVIVITFIAIMRFNVKISNEFMINCQDKGYSYGYCVAHK